MGASPGFRAGRAAGTPRPGRPPVIGRETVIAAAAGCGFEALTLTAVAARMKVRPSALYRLFPSRTALVAAAAEHVIAGRPWPAAPPRPAEGWRRYLAEAVWTAWDLYDQYPGLAQEVASLAFAPPSLVALTQREYGVLADAGFSPRDALLVTDLAGELALSPFLIAGGGGSAAEDGQPARALDRIAGRRRRLMLGGGQPGNGADATAEVIAAVVGGDPRAWLAAKLEFFLDAAEARLGRA